MLSNLMPQGIWYEKLKEEFKKPYFQELSDHLEREREKYILYPRAEDVFKAFELCPFEKLKLVLLGQDPYHGKNQADGLAFSLSLGGKKAPSLQNIFKEMESDLGLNSRISSSDLSPWAKQGVFLLNCCLSVREHEANSHKDLGWGNFSDACIKILNEEKENLVFILWGDFAQKKEALIDEQKHLIIKSPHPSPLSAYRGFFGSKPFSKANRYLESKGIETIEWELKRAEPKEAQYELMLP